MSIPRLASSYGLKNVREVDMGLKQKFELDHDTAPQSSSK
jgi:hypothetical protein